MFRVWPARYQRRRAIAELEASWFHGRTMGNSFGNCKTCLICAEIANAFMQWRCLRHGGILLGLNGRCLSQVDVTACFDRWQNPRSQD